MKSLSCKVKKYFSVLLAIASVQGAYSAATLKVDLMDSIRPVTHCASGSLYGLTETLPSDISGLVAPLKCNLFCLPPEGGSGNQHPFGDGFIAAERLKGTTAKVQITFPDLLPNWPYKWPGQQSWLNSVSKYLDKKVNGNYDNIDSYVIWNEPDGTWNNSNGNLNTTVWKPTYDLIRQKDPKTKIVGPCISYYRSDRMKEFLTFCKQNNCMPDLICWHQWGSEGFISAVEDVHKIERELGLPTDYPLCINEYCAGASDDKKKYEGCPGYSVPFIAKFERNNVESATISWWFTNLPGRLGSLLTANNEKGGGWWLYKWYGDMEGYMAMVTPPNDKSDGVDGFAAVDRKQYCASLVLGGNTEGDVNVVFSRLPDFLGGKVHVKIERVTWKSKDTPVSSTDLISETDMAVSGSGLTVPVKIESKLYGYRILLTALNVPQYPYNNVAATIPGVIEAENYDEAGQGFSYFDVDTENKGRAYRTDEVDIVAAGQGYAVGYTDKGEWLEYTVNVADTDEYTVTANVSNSNELEGFQLYVDDKLVTNSYTIPQVSEDWSEYKEVPVCRTRLEKGEHIIKIQIVGSYINIDWLKFEVYDPTGVNIVFTDADLQTLENVHYYDLKGHSLLVGDIRKDEIYVLVTADGKRIKFIKR
ncbi:MAG: carbohydrate-binding protein [Paludibacteraceae bacterium]|nr:carbohydrate-binding protein [Paludibacteraceae bacterium]